MSATYRRWWRCLAVLLTLTSRRVFPRQQVGMSVVPQITEAPKTTGPRRGRGRRGVLLRAVYASKEARRCGR